MSDGIQDALGTLPTIRQRSRPAYGDGEVLGVNGSTGAVTQFTGGGSTGLATGFAAGGSAQEGILGQAHWAVVGKLAPGLIHEINNVLCVMGSHLQMLMLQSTDRGRDLLKSLEAMNQNLARAGTITHRFGAYARPEDRFPCRLRLSDLVEGALALALLQRPFRELHIRKEFAQNLPEINGRSGPLMDALVEVLAVAAHAIPRGGTLTISTHSGNGWVMVGFTGSGQWPRLSDGSMALARHILEQQGGDLVCERAPARAENGSAGLIAGASTELRTGIWLVLRRSVSHLIVSALNPLAEKDGLRAARGHVSTALRRHDNGCGVEDEGKRRSGSCDVIDAISKETTA